MNCAGPPAFVVSLKENDPQQLFRANLYSPKGRPSAKPLQKQFRLTLLESKPGAAASGFPSRAGTSLIARAKSFPDALTVLATDTGPHRPVWP